MTASLEGRAVVTLASIFSLRMLGLFMIYPVFAIYAIQLNFSTPTWIGVALGGYGLTQALFQIPFGLASDRLGRKPLILLGLALFILGSVVAAVSDSIYGVVLGRCLQGMSAIGSVMMALVADLTREAVRARAMAAMGITIGFSFALAMVLGPVLESFAGVKGIFWLTAVFGTMAILLLWAFVPTPKGSLQGARKESLQSALLKVLTNKDLFSLNFGVFALHASLVALFLKIPGMLLALGFESGTNWHFYLPLILVSLLTAAPLLLWIEQKNGVNRELSMLILALFLAEGGLFFCMQSTFGLAISLWIFFTAFNCLEASLPSLVSKLSPPEYKGAALGIYSSAQFLGLFIGGLAGGWFDNDYGMVGVLGFCMTLALVWRMCLMCQERGDRCVRPLNRTDK